MVKGKEEVLDEEIKAFEDLMCALFKELFDPSIPFSPVEKTSAACKYCKVKDICEKGDKTTVEDDEESSSEGADVPLSSPQATRMAATDKEAAAPTKRDFFIFAPN